MRFPRPSASYTAAPANGTVGVTTLLGCTWTVDNTNTWISIASALNNTNSGSVSYTVATNTTALSRSGVVTIAGQSYTVTQDGAACQYALSAPSASYTAAPSSGTVDVTTLLGCIWTVDNTNTWLSITSALNNTNSGTVSYTVATNTTALSRSGVVTIAGQSYTVSQSGAPCNYTLSSTNQVHGFAATNSSVGCDHFGGLCLDSGQHERVDCHYAVRPAGLGARSWLTA